MEPRATANLSTNWAQASQQMAENRQRRAMQTSRGAAFWATHQGGQANYISSEQKREMAATGETFLITSVAEGTGNYGEQWRVSILRESEDHENILTFAKNPGRDTMMNDLRDAVKEEYIPATLARVINPDTGNAFYVLNPPNWDEEVNEADHGTSAAIDA